jgi:hypothetical protein
MRTATNLWSPNSPKKIAIRIVFADVKQQHTSGQSVPLLIFANQRNVGKIVLEIKETPHIVVRLKSKN